MTLHPFAFLLISLACVAVGFLLGHAAGQDKPTTPDRDTKGRSHVNWRDK